MTPASGWAPDGAWLFRTDIACATAFDTHRDRTSAVLTWLVWLLGR